MNNKIYIIYAIALLALSSCDFLGNKPKGMTIPTTTDDYERLLNYQSLSSAISELPYFFTDDVKLLDKNHQASSYVYLSKGDSERNVFSYKPGQLYLEGTKDYDWNSAYDRLFTFNTIINAVMDSEGGSEQKKLAIKAEALVARAYEYFELVNIYGNHYDPTTSSTDYGVPYIKAGDINQTYVRSTVAEVYEFILADLAEAMPNISEVVPNTLDPNKTAIYSFYARIYLYMGDYAKALEFANQALALNSNLLDYNDYEMTIGVTWGRVHLKGDEATSLSDVKSPEVNYFKFFGGSLQGSVMLSEEMRDLFKEDLDSQSKDLRKWFFFSEDSVDMGRVDYFPGECAYVFYTYNNSAFSSVQDLLVAAEAEARIGDKDKAMAHINRLRDNRIEDNIDLTASSKDEALELVLDERRRELAMRGNFRFHDLRRLNKESKFAKTVIHKVDGVEYKLEPNSPLYTFPINSEIFIFNPDMPQYDRK